MADPPPAGPAMQDAAERGRLLHGLFERLPALPPEHRRAAGEAWLAGNPLGEGLVDRALSIVDHPDFADMFGADALAEAPIAAVVGGQVIAGTVDRLAVIFPDRRIEAALLYTAGPRLIAVPAEALAALKPGLAATEQSLPSRA